MQFKACAIFIPHNVIMFRLFASILCFVSVYGELINTKVVRVTNLDSHVTKSHIYFSLFNLKGNIAESFLFVTENDTNIAYISFKDEHNNECSYRKTSVLAENGKVENVYRVQIKGGLAEAQTAQFKVELVELNVVKPLYKTRSFDQELSLIYKSNYYFYSCYKTNELETYYIFNNETREIEISHSTDNPVNETLQYFAKNVEPYRVEKIEIKFKREMQFLVVTKLERIIDVSHFGVICVEDRVDVSNEAGKLVGPVKFRKLDDGSWASWWYTFLPASAVHIQYYDILGYNFKVGQNNFEDHIVLKFQPRYPLLSGWKTSYVLKYCVPIYEYVRHNFEDQYVLRMRALDHVLDNFVAEDVLVKVLLPENSEIVNVNLPIGFTEQQKEKTYTSLAFYGRPTVVMNGSNLVDEHINDFEVEYTFSKYYKYTSGCIMCVYLYSVFLFLIFVIRKTN